MTSSAKIQAYLVAAVCLLSPLVGLTQQFDKHRHFHSFEVPDSQATYPTSINEARTITGYYITQAGVTRGFVREENQTITTFDIPGSVLTQPLSINAAGDVAGFYNVASSTTLLPIVPQGFIRKPDGSVTTFGNTLNTDDAASFWAAPVAINVAGEVVGNFPDIVLASNVFIRSATGVVSSFGIGLGAGDPTYATGLNASGAVIGYTGGGSNFEQGFVWNGQGSLPSPISFTPVFVPGSTATYPIGINGEGTIVGCYTLNSTNQDFVLYPDGDLKTLDIPGTVPACVTNQSSQIFPVPQSLSINERGTITGWYINIDNKSRGFVRFENGKIHTFAPPGSRQIIPTSINNRDVITGYYSRGAEVVGFIREP